MSGEGAWDRALLGAALSIARPDLFGGLLIKASSGPVLTAWIDEVRALGGDDRAPVMVPASVSADRLHASLSVSRSLAEGRPVYQSGLLEDAAGGVMIISGAERLQEGVSALLAAELDPAGRSASPRIALIAVDESREPGETSPPILAERLAFRADLNELRYFDVGGAGYTAADVDRIRTGMSSVKMADEDLSAVAAACLGMGVSSLQVPVFCMHAARAIAALEARSAVASEDIMRACQLILPGRGRPVPEAQQAPQPQPDAPDNTSGDDSSATDEEALAETAQSLETRIIDSIPSAHVEMMASRSRATSRGRAGVSGRSGAHVIALDRGRPDRPFKSQTGRGRVDVLATLRAAAPMQKARQGQTGREGLQIRKSDLRMKRFKRRKQSSVIFVVDASGSAAMHRMAEAKGAVERLLSQCYSRRDLVSLISFAGEQARMMLPPSRSLVRARRQISDLAGGGATPLAHALVEAFQLAKSEHDRGRTPFLVFLTDGRGNIALDGTPDRERAGSEVSSLAKTLIRDRFAAVFFDTSRRPDPRTRRLSDDLGAQYQFLPNADGETVSKVVRERIGTR